MSGKFFWKFCLLFALIPFVSHPISPGSNTTSGKASTGIIPTDFPTYIPFVYRQTFYYVSLSGDDAQKGDFDHPWRTVRYAVSHVAPGAVIEIRGGEYNEAVEIKISGQPNKPITLTNYNGEVVTINGGGKSAINGRTDYWNIKNLTLTSSADRTIWLEPAAHWQLINNNITGAVVIIGDHNLFQGNTVDGSQHTGNPNGIMDGSIDSHHNQYIGNTIHDFPERGIWSQWNTHDITIKNNHVYNINGSDGACIDLDSAIGVTYRNNISKNIVHDCGSIGIELENSFATTVENNLVYNTGVEGIVAINYDGCEVGGENNQYGSPTGDCRGVILDTNVRQNIIYNGGSTGGVVCYDAAGVKVTANIVYGGSSVALFIADDENFCHHWDVRDNIFSNHKRAEISVSNPASLNFDQYNLLYHPGNNAAYQVFGSGVDFYTLSEWNNETGLGQKSIESNPMFVDPAGHNFHLQPISLGVNNGIDPGIPTDFDGAPRPLGAGFDIGAYEQAGR